MRTAEGVLLAVEKRVTSTLMEPSSIEKILEIDSHIGRETQCIFCCFIWSFTIVSHTLLRALVFTGSLLYIDVTHKSSID